jgi:hypothetical protein
MLEELLQVPPRGWVSVFHDDETAAGMPDEHGHRAGLNPALSDGGCDSIRNFVGPFTAGGNCEGG